MSQSTFTRAFPHPPFSTFNPDDISEFHKQVRRNGLVVPDLEVTFYGMTEFRIDDPDGNRLWIGQNVSTEPNARGLNGREPWVGKGCRLTIVGAGR